MLASVVQKWGCNLTFYSTVQYSPVHTRPCIANTLDYSLFSALVGSARNLKREAGVDKPRLGAESSLQEEEAYQKGRISVLRV